MCLAVILSHETCVRNKTGGRNSKFVGPRHASFKRKCAQPCAQWLRKVSGDISPWINLIQGDTHDTTLAFFPLACPWHYNVRRRAHINTLIPPSEGATWKEQKKNSRIWTTAARGVGRLTAKKEKIRQALFIVEMKHRLRRKKTAPEFQGLWVPQKKGTQPSGYCPVMMIPRLTVLFRIFPRVLPCHICTGMMEGFPCNNGILLPPCFMREKTLPWPKWRAKS